ncbi:unnamed protein product [Ambrosiozyma monospora]|uniref:Unnamed protein product n=1 Tax=Ambrosiozyma monospora TaxID=43982 RepID=A0A9W6YW86_AMBMO|nr:unnamed protein product [Ambrosiozyma monospora]
MQTLQIPVGPGTRDQGPGTRDRSPGPCRLSPVTCLAPPTGPRPLSWTLMASMPISLVSGGDSGEFFVWSSFPVLMGEWENGDLDSGFWILNS